MSLNHVPTNLNKINHFWIQPGFDSFVKASLSFFVAEPWLTRSQVVSLSNFTLLPCVNLQVNLHPVTNSIVLQCQLILERSFPLSLK